MADWLLTQRFRVVLFAIAVACVLAGCAGKKEPLRAIYPRSNSGFIHPLRYEGVIISSRYGERRGDRLHKGVDLQVPSGTPVHATAAGTVSFSGEQRGYGDIIVVEHGNGWATAYAHLRKRRADQGERVQQGQHIGDVGRTGNATTDHLHYEVRRDNQPIDPMPYLP